MSTAVMSTVIEIKEMWHNIVTEVLINNITSHIKNFKQSTLQEVNSNLGCFSQAPGNSNLQQITNSFRDFYWFFLFFVLLWGFLKIILLFVTESIALYPSNFNIYKCRSMKVKKKWTFGPLGIHSFYS